MLSELQNGPVVTSCASINMKDIIKLIDSADNERILSEIVNI
jgi:hypothetical protein